MSELVVLVDEDNSVLGTAPKDTIHTTNTPLHRGFSCFLFNSKRELLLTKRAKSKKTFLGVWTNTVCGHPGPGESVVEAALRRLNQELGIMNQDVRGMKEVAPYRYKFADKNGIVENEICPVLVAYTDVDPKFDRNEVDEWKWVKWEDFLKALKRNPDIYSPWCKEETLLINHLLDSD